MKSSVFLSLVFGLLVIPNLNAADRAQDREIINQAEIEAMQEVNSKFDGVLACVSQKAISGAKFATKSTLDLIKRNSKVVGSVALIAAMPFVIKKAISSCEFSDFFMKNIPMLGCMFQSGYDLTFGLFGDIAKFGSGIKDWAKLELKLKVNLDDQKNLTSKISSTSNNFDQDLFIKRVQQNDLAGLKTREREILREIKEAKEKANLYKFGYHILRGGLAGLAGYQLLQNR